MLDKTGYNLRERSGFEALDAGLLLYRNRFLRIQLSWIGVFLPLLIGSLFLPDSILWISPLVLWWIRPLWDRLILRKVAHLFFGSDGKPPWKGIFRELLSDLTWRRFSMWRHYSQPIRGLEGLQGNRLGKRVRFIFREYRGEALALGIVMFLIETGFVAGIVTFVSNMNNFIPYTLRLNLSFEAPWVYRAIILGWGLVSIITVPATVSMGFALYINRRVIMEGWDLEVTFSRRAVFYKSTLGILMFALLMGLGPGTALAQAEEAPVESLAQVLESDDFGDTRTRTGWRWKKESKDPADNGNSSEMFDDLFENGGGIIASILRILIISVGVFTIGVIVWKNRFALFRLLPEQIDDDERMSPLRGKTGKNGILPSLDSAPDLYNQGQHRDAWSILYRHLIRILGQQISNSPGEDATEGEWLRILREPKKESHTRLISGWRKTAYAHRTPDSEEFGVCYKMLTEFAEAAKKTPV